MAKTGAGEDSGSEYEASVHSIEDEEDHDIDEFASDSDVVGHNPKKRKAASQTGSQPKISTAFGTIKKSNVNRTGHQNPTKKAKTSEVKSITVEDDSDGLTYLGTRNITESASKEIKIAPEDHLRSTAETVVPSQCSAGSTLTFIESVSEEQQPSQDQQSFRDQLSVRDSITALLSSQLNLDALPTTFTTRIYSCLAYLGTLLESPLESYFVITIKDNVKRIKSLCNSNLSDEDKISQWSKEGLVGFVNTICASQGYTTPSRTHIQNACPENPETVKIRAESISSEQTGISGHKNALTDQAEAFEHTLASRQAAYKTRILKAKEKFATTLLDREATITELESRIASLENELSTEIQGRKEDAALYKSNLDKLQLASEEQAQNIRTYHDDQLSECKQQLRAVQAAADIKRFEIEATVESRVDAEMQERRIQLSHALTRLSIELRNVEQLKRERDHAVGTLQLNVGVLRRCQERALRPTTNRRQGTVSTSNNSGKMSMESEALKETNGHTAKTIIQADGGGRMRMPEGADVSALEMDNVTTGAEAVGADLMACEREIDRDFGQFG